MGTLGGGAVRFVVCTPEIARPGPRHHPITVCDREHDFLCLRSFCASEKRSLALVGHALRSSPRVTRPGIGASFPSLRPRVFSLTCWFYHLKHGNAHIAMERLRLDQVCGCVLPFTSCLHVHNEARERRCLKPVRMTLLLAVGHRIRRHVNHSSGYLCHIGQFQPGLPLCASPHGVRAIALPRCVVHVVAAVTPSHSLPP